MFGLAIPRTVMGFEIVNLVPVSAQIFAQQRKDPG